MGRSATSADAAARLLRQTQALGLRAHGHTIRAIAKALGVGTGTAHRLVSDAMAAERASISQARADHVELELHRYDLYLQSLAKKIQAGDPRAIDTALRIAERRSRLLGLDAPTKIASTDPDGKPVKHDLSKCTAQELEALEAVHAKLTQGGKE